MQLSKVEFRSFVVELIAAVALGGVAAFAIPAVALSRVDEMLVTFLSILLAAVIPGVALTATAQRPSSDSALAARKLGADLELQVSFWFGFLLIGGFSVAVIIVSGALDWKLVTPRPAYIPSWIPSGSAWLVFMAIASAGFTAIRARHVASAIVDLIRLGTDAHVAESVERRRRLQAEVHDAIRRLPTSVDRGAPTEGRSRRPRDTPN